MRRLEAETVWYAYEAVASFLWTLVFTVTAIYFVTELGMSPLELVVVGTVMELTVFVFEVPTGIVADTYSRRLSIVIGHVVMGLGFVVVVGIAAFAGMWSESYDRLWQAHVIRDVGLPSVGGLEPIVWFGGFALVGLVLAMVVAQPLERRLADVEPVKLARTLFRLDVLLLLSSLVFALAGSLWLAMLGSYTLFVARNLASPIFSAWLNRSIDESSVRATVISITNQADAVGQWTGGPALGAVGNVFGLRAALCAGAACLLPALALYRRAIRHGGSEPVLGALPQAVEP